MPNRTAVIQTNKGRSVSNARRTREDDEFHNLAERGYSDGVIFHRCIKGFMIRRRSTGTGVAANQPGVAGLTTRSVRL